MQSLLDPSRLRPPPPNQTLPGSGRDPSDKKSSNTHLNLSLGVQLQQQQQEQDENEILSISHIQDIGPKVEML